MMVKWGDKERVFCFCSILALIVVGCESKSEDGDMMAMAGGDAATAGGGAAATMGGGTAAESFQAIESACGVDENEGMSAGAPSTTTAGKCYRCLNDDPWAVECSEVVQQADGTEGCVAGGDDVEACSTLSQCCMAVGREASSDGSCMSPDMGGNPASAGGAEAMDEMVGGNDMVAQSPDEGTAATGCAQGAMCVSGTCISSEFNGTISRVILGKGQITEAGNTLVKLNVPQGAISFILNVSGLGAELGIATKITSPSGRVVFDYNADLVINRTDATDVAYSVMVPNAPGIDVEAGEWSFLLMSGGQPVNVTIDAIIKTQAATTRTLDLNMYFVGLDEYGSEQAQSDMEFQTLIDSVAAAYASVDINIGSKNYIDITGDDADRLGVVDGTDGPNAELFQLFALSAGQTNRAVDIFFVADMKGIDAGFTLLGLSGGTPGPALAHGAARSGVAVSMANFLEAKEGGDMMQMESARRLTEIIFAHEMGHYLGLYHTTERNGKALDTDGIVGADPLDDTPICPDSSDANMNKRLSSKECVDFDGGNLMFWGPSRDSRALTAQQKAVLENNPLIQ